MSCCDSLDIGKFHACGNDFVVAVLDIAQARSLADRLSGWGSSPSLLSQQICDRHTGIGADGLILGITASPAALCGDELPGSWGVDVEQLDRCTASSAALKDSTVPHRAATGDTAASDTAASDTAAAGDTAAEGRTVGVRMLLHNSDGSRAAVSGNGLACLSHAIISKSGDAAVGALPVGTQDRGSNRSTPGRPVDGDPDGSASAAFDAAWAASRGVRRLPIATDAGWLETAVRSSGTAASRRVEVAMPPMHDGPQIPARLASRIVQDFSAETRFATGDIGNQHLVISVGRELSAQQTARFGAAYEAYFDDGINVEFVWPTERADPALGARVETSMTVWERGAGLTRACGSGAVVAAARAREWFVPTGQGTVGVRMPGARADVGGFDPDCVPGDLSRLRLAVHAHHVADICWPLRRPQPDDAGG